MTNKQTILIAGATGNIGGGAAVALAKRGARVVVLGRKLERLEQETLGEELRLRWQSVVPGLWCSGVSSSD